MGDIAAILRYYLASTLILLCSFPIGMLLFSKSTRHVVLYTRVLGLLLVNYLVWFLSAIGLLSFSAGGILISLLMMAVIGIFLAWRAGHNQNTLFEWYHRNRKDLIFDEVVFLVAFVLFAWFVSYQPKIFGTEKYMDFAFFNALMRGVNIPPHDPWFAGESINYYYGGYMIMALLGRLSALPPAYAYNLALAFLFASAVALSWAFGRQLTGSRKLGVWAPLTLAIMGNMDGFHQVLHVGWPFRINYFNSSRVIVDGVPPNIGNTINEFPFFSFIHADLHPHVMAIPFVLIFIILLYEFLLGFRPHSLKTTPLAFGGKYLVLCLALGSLGFINGLDLPSFFILFAGCLVLGLLRATSVWNHERSEFLKSLCITSFIVLLVYLVGIKLFRIEGRGIALLAGLLGAVTLYPAYLHHEKRWSAGILIPALLLLSVFIVYFSHYFYFQNFIAPREEAGFLGLSIYHSKATEFLTVFHLQLFLTTVMILAGLLHLKQTKYKALMDLGFLGLGTLLVFSFALTGHLIIAFLIVAILASLWILPHSIKRPNILFAHLMVFLALCILLGCEFVHIRDAYGQQLQRMNTLFKFHYQAWILFALAAPVMLLVLRRAVGFSPEWKVVLRGVAVFLLVLNLFYPVGIVWARLPLWKPGVKVEHREPRTLDGMSYLDREHPPEAKAIRWLNENIQGTPVILEYPGKRAYSYDSRISTNTGLPTLVGWINHESIWRKTWVKRDEKTRNQLQAAGRSVDGWSLTGYRQSIADRIYQDTSFDAVKPLLDEYQIEYIYVGELERANYPAEGLRKFEEHCEKVYDSVGVTIYRVR